MRCLACMLVMLLVCLGGCRREAVRPDAPRPRVVTYSPALTRIVFYLGLGEHVVGVSSQC